MLILPIHVLCICLQAYSLYILPDVANAFTMMLAMIVIFANDCVLYYDCTHYYDLMP